MATGSSWRRRVALGSIRSVALGAVLFALYCANGREIGSGDTQPALLHPIALLRGDGLRLDRYRALWPEPLPYMVAERRGDLVSRFPLGAPLLAVPFVAPQLWVLDAVEPGWDTDPARAFLWARRMGKVASAAIGALTGVAIDRMLLALGLGACALPATLIATLGSELWMIGSQSPWQHGPAAFALATMLALLLPQPTPRWRLILAGGACALITYSRPSVGFLSVLTLGWVIYAHRRRTGWFLILPLLTGAPLLAFNLWYFASPIGGYSELMKLVGARSHEVTGFWGSNVVEGLVGTLVSPSRGLFVFCPWIPLSLVTWPAIAPALRRWPLVCVLLWGVPMLLVQLALQSTWWAGWSFGPRYWTELTPLFAIVLGFALAWARRRAPGYCALLLVAGVVAIGIQALGAFHYPSSFNMQPKSIDHDRERLWSWRDGELARELREGSLPWE